MEAGKERLLHGHSWSPRAWARHLGHSNTPARSPHRCGSEDNQARARAPGTKASDRLERRSCNCIWNCSVPGQEKTLCSAEPSASRLTSHDSDKDASPPLSVAAGLFKFCLGTVEIKKKKKTVFNFMILMGEKKRENEISKLVALQPLLF